MFILLLFKKLTLKSFFLNTFGYFACSIYILIYITYRDLKATQSLNPLIGTHAYIKKLLSNAPDTKLKHKLCRQFYADFFQNRAAVS